MWSSHAALTDSRSSVSRVGQRNLVSVTFPYPSLFSKGKALGTRLCAALLLYPPPQRRSFALRDKEHERERLVIK